MTFGPFRARRPVVGSPPRLRKPTPPDGSSGTPLRPTRGRSGSSTTPGVRAVRAGDRRTMTAVHPASERATPIRLRHDPTLLAARMVRRNLSTAELYEEAVREAEGV